MSAGVHPIQMCDAEEGCTDWQLDIPATGAVIVSGGDPLAGWVIDRYADTAFCPDHVAEVAR